MPHNRPQVWRIPPDDLEMSPRHVDVWLTSTESGEEQLQAYRQCLSRAELARAEKFRSREKYREYVVTRGLLRTALTRMTGLNPAQIGFQSGRHGKPYLDGSLTDNAVAFNVSHSHGLALVALAPVGRLGVDLEKIRPEAAWRALARRYFSTAECQTLDSYSQHEQLRAFFACWTRKEAFVKALGAGVSYGLKEFDVSIDPDADDVELTVRDRDEDAAGWLIKTLPAPGNFAAALAVDRRHYELRLWKCEV